MPKILLLSPAPPPRTDLYKVIITNHFSMALVGLAGALQAAGHDVAIYDSFYYTEHNLAYFLGRHSDARWFGISIGASSLWKSAEELACLIKSNNPDGKIVVGGIHPTLFPEDTLKSPYIDFVVVGEGEHTLLELLRSGTAEGVAGLVYRGREGKIIHNPEREVIENLDSLPLPAYDLIDLSRSRLTTGAYKRLPAVMIRASRGCPFSCKFCANPIVNRKIRYKSVEKILDELCVLCNRGVREVFLQMIHFYIEMI